MATAKKIPSGKWRVQMYMGVDDKGKRIYKSFTASTKKEAEFMAASYKLTGKEKKQSKLTLKEAMDEFISLRQNVLSPATARRYESLARNAYPAIIEKKVCKITQTDVQRFVNVYAKDHAPKTVLNAYGLLSEVMAKYAPDLELDTDLPAKIKPTLEIPNDQQVAEIIRNAGSEEMRLAFVLGSALGLRRAEIAALTWGDAKDGIISITKAMVQKPDGEWIFKAPKTTAGTRLVPIPDYIEKIMDDMRPHGSRSTDRIFHFTPDAITMRFIKVRKKLGLSCRFHDLRHYNASVMLALGIPDKYAMARLGHATTNMLKTTYQHIMDSKQLEVTKKICDYMSENQRL